MDDGLAAQLAELRRLREKGLLSEAAYQAAAAGMRATYQADVQSGVAAQGAGATAVGQGGVNVGGSVGGDIITGNVYHGEPTQDPAEALRIYCRVVAQSSGHLPLRGVDFGASDPASGQQPLGLANVYIDLDTRTPVKKEARDRQESTRPAQLALEKEETRPLSALEAVADNRHLVLTGDPGGGKSTFVNHLAHCLAAHLWQPEGNWLAHLAGWPQGSEDTIPLRVILRDFAHSLPDPLPQPAEAQHLGDFITGRLKAQKLDFVARPLAQALDAGRVLLLFDGLDEVATAAQRAFVRDAVLAFVGRYHPDNRVLVTCRVLSYQPPAGEEEPDLRLPAGAYPTFELAPFTAERIDRFVAAWYEELARLGQVPASDVSGLTGKLRQAVRRPDLWRLASNPLLLTVMALVHTHKGRLPDARALLYEDTVDVLLWRWEQIKAGGRADAPTLRQLLLDAGRTDLDLKKVLWRLAYEAHAQQAPAEGPVDGDGEQLADIGELTLMQALVRLVDGDWNWAHQVVQAMKLRAGLLLERSPGVFTFPHRTFQEYLAGAHLSVQRNFARHAAELAGQGANWREVILLAVGRLVYLTGDTTDRPLALVNRLCPAQPPEGDAAWRNGWLAGDVLLEMGLQWAQADDWGQELLARVRERLAALVAGGRLTPRERAEAGRTLARLGDSRPGVGTILRSGQKLPDIVWGGEVPAGMYTIGGDAHAYRGETRKQVPIKQPYRLARYPVTYAQFQCFVDAPDFDDERWWAGMPAEEEAYGESYQLREMSEQAFLFDNHPRENVSWYQALAFCRWLTAKLHAGELPAGELAGDVRQYKITLPHEYEWEVAARWPNNDVTNRLYPWGPEFDVAKANTWEGGIRQTTAVGIYPAGQNAALGLYDLSGNVWEWCRNKYDDPEHEVVDDSGQRRVLRGGSWNDTAEYARAACRDYYSPAFRGSYFGFRLVVVGGGGASSPIS